MRKFLLGLTLFLSFTLLSAAFFFTGITLADGRIPWAIFAALSLLAAIPIWRWWRRITGSHKFIWNYLYGIVVIAAIISSAFYMSNYFLADPASKHPVTATVVNKYSREQAKRRTVGRRIIYVPGEKTYTYHIVLRFENGLEKERPLPIKKYLKVRIGDKMEYDVERGFFGIPVIKH